MIDRMRCSIKHLFLHNLMAVIMIIILFTQLDVSDFRQVQRFQRRDVVKKREFFPSAFLGQSVVLMNNKTKKQIISRTTVIITIITTRRIRWFTTEAIEDGIRRPWRDDSCIAFKIIIIFFFTISTNFGWFNFNEKKKIYIPFPCLILILCKYAYLSITHAHTQSHYTCLYVYTYIDLYMRTICLYVGY